jgi:hypothetical protein
MKSFMIIAAVLSTLCYPVIGAEETTQKKNITIVTGQSSADGKSDVQERLLEECIISLPDVASLDAVVQSDSKYLKEVNGDPVKNDFVKTFSAVIDINYMLYQKTLFIVTTNSVSGTEPVMKVMEKNIRQSIRFESNAANGDIYAGRSRREYYFSSSEAAIADARKQAQVWLKQQAAIVCKQAPAKTGH